jgi:two-component system CheB/CheR fusion protein
MDLVVIGSSAGGVEALSVLVHTLSPDFPAPIVLAQHLDPNRPSRLDVILQHRTSLPVELVNASSVLQPGHIYVVPSNRHVQIRDHRVEIKEDQVKRPRPSVDTLLSTAATCYGERLIAVILTGSGSDGSVGAIDVKNAGGTVIIQNPQTARYPSMPLALPPTAVDFEIDLEHIGPLLQDLLMGVNIPPSEERTETVLHDILEQVSHQASLDFRPYKTSTILRRINRRMTATHCPSMREYAEYLKVHPDEVTELVKAFLINVTQFFRDPEAFVYLRETILPKLIAHARARDRVLRFWAAGCATGEEAYSLAMLLTDVLGTELSQWSIKVFATDLDDAAITFARRGLYSENVLKDVPSDYRERFFERVDHGYRISKALRQMVIFGQQDLSRSAPFPHIDLIFCRNVLIYFTPALQEYVLNQLAFSLAPHGYLFLGKAETVRPLQTLYELVNKQWKVYRCSGHALPSVRRQALADVGMRRQEGQLMSQQRKGGKPAGEADLSHPGFEIGQVRTLNEMLLRFLPLGVVVIDRGYHTLTANNLARRLLGLREVGGEQDFLHAVRGVPYHTIRTSIDTLFRERNPITLPEVELDSAQGGNGYVVSLTFALMQLDTASPDLALISVTDVTQQVQARQQLETAQSEQTHLLHELSTANKRLSDVNKELLDANEALQVSNEELMLTHEELQASIEEFETTNEELQATNEELETNNEELQATNEELETTNDELRARAGELQELTTTLDTERRRLAEIVELAPFSILVLHGPSLVVEAYNPRDARLWENQPVQGRPLDEVIDLFWEDGTKIVQLAREAYRLDTPQTTQRILVSTQQQRKPSRQTYFRYMVVPSHDPTGTVNGVIIYARDVTEERSREAEEERERLHLIFENLSPAALALFDAQTGELIMGSQRYLEEASRATGMEREALIGQPWHSITFLGSTEQAEQLWQQVVQERKPVRLPEFAYRFSPDGPEVVWDYSLTPLLDAERDADVRYVLVSLLEITEQVQVRHDLEQVNTLRDDFVSMATHELRGPLTTVKGHAQLLQRALQRRQKAQPDDARLPQELAMTEQIAHQTERMNRLLGELLDTAHLRNQAFDLHLVEQVDLIALVQRVVETYPLQGREVRLHLDEQLALGRYDPDRLEQVLHNLLSNALKYSPPEAPVEVRVQKQAHEVVVSVKDEGEGMSEEDLAHIFERFYRADHSRHEKVEGLGLGLYIAYEIVKQQGGRMWCESTLGQGSTFCFALPLQDEHTD